MSSDPHSDLTVLQELTARLSGARSLEDALYDVTEAALRLLPADHASIRLYDESRTRLLASARAGQGTEQPSLPLGKGEGIAGWVMAQGLPANVPDVAADGRFVAGSDQGFSIRSMVAEPLLSAGRTIGVLSASSPELSAFQENDVLLARILANCAVPAIERARLERLAAVDPVTLAFNAGYLAPRLAEEMQRARHSGLPLSLLSLHLDGLDHVRASFGADVVGRVRSLFAERVRSVTRRFDVLVETGEATFVVLLPMTVPLQANTEAERLCRTMREPLQLQTGGFLTQTVSVGVATLSAGEPAEHFVERASAAMRDAHAQGGNRVARAKPVSESA